MDLVGNRGQTPSTLLAALLGTLPAQESQPARPPRLGVFFWHDSPNDVSALAGIRAAWQATGLQHEFVVRKADSDPARAHEQLRELRTLGCSLVFALGTQAALLARDDLPDLPVVFTAVTNPVASGVVASWAPTGTRLCGNSNWVPPETLLHVFRMAIPDLTRIGMLRSKSAGVVSAAELAAMREHLARPGTGKLAIVERVVADADGIGAAVQQLLAEKVQAIWVPIDFTIYQNMPLVRKALGGARVPLVSSSLQGAQNGAIVGVLVDYVLLGKGAGALSIEILRRGKDPGTFPITTMRGYQVIVNLAAANALGYELPLSLLAIADQLVATELPR